MMLKEIEVKKDVFLSGDAQRLVSKAMRFDSELIIDFGAKKANCKSIMGVIALELKKGDVITVIAKGDDQEAALAELEHLF